MKIENDKEADAILGLLLLQSNAAIRREEEEGYKYKTELQLEMLNRVFKITKYPSTETRENIAILLKTTTRRVQIWFQNARQAIKEENNILKNIQLDSENESVDEYADIIRSVPGGKYMSYYIPSRKLIEIYQSIIEKN